MTLSVKRFSELTNDELYAVLKLRVDVFVVEQKCAYPDLDGKDTDALHVFLSDEDGVAAYLRALREYAGRSRRFGREKAEGSHG